MAKVEETERAAAAAKRQQQQQGSNGNVTGTEIRVCRLCEKGLPFNSYNRNQWNKGSGKSKCRDCVDAAIANEKAALQQSNQNRIDEARRKVGAAKAKGLASEILKAESELAALEAERVTGLKPVSMSGRGGRGSGRGRGRAGKGFAARGIGGPRGGGRGK